MSTPPPPLPSGSSDPRGTGGQPRGQLPQPDPGGRAPSHPHLHWSQRRYGRPHHRCLPSSSPFCCLLIAPSVVPCASCHRSCSDRSLQPPGRSCAHAKAPPTFALTRLVLCSARLPADYAVEERPAEVVLMQQLEEGGPDPLVFVLNANLLAMVKLVNCEWNH